MVMRFWFNKKMRAQDTTKGVSCEAVDNSGHEAKDRAAAPGPEPLAAGGASPTPAQPAAAGGGAQVQRAPDPEVPLKTPPALAASGPTDVAAVAAASAEAQKPVLRPVGGLVRLAARPAGEKAAVQPLAAAVPVPVVPVPAQAPSAVPAVASASGHPVLAASPKAEKVAAAAVDKGVVERAAEGAAAVRPKVDQRALYYQLMNGLYDAVLVLDAQGHVVDGNARVADLLGYSREEAWDLPIGKVITGMASQMFEHLKRNLAENHHILIDARCFRKDGTSFAGEVGVSTITLTRGGNMVFAIRNVERRKSAMNDLRKSHAALDIALAPTFVCDTDGFFLVVNQTLLDAFGIPDVERAKRMRFIDVMPEAARFFLRASCGEKVRETLSAMMPDGVPRTFQMALVPVQNGQNVTGVAGSVLQM